MYVGFGNQVVERYINPNMSVDMYAHLVNKNCNWVFFVHFSYEIRILLLFVTYSRIML